jgi:hypothetical protein
MWKYSNLRFIYSDVDFLLSTVKAKSTWQLAWLGPVSQFELGKFLFKLWDNAPSFLPAQFVEKCIMKVHIGIDFWTKLIKKINDIFLSNKFLLNHWFKELLPHVQSSLAYLTLVLVIFSYEIQWTSENRAFKYRNYLISGQICVWFPNGRHLVLAIQK